MHRLSLTAAVLTAAAAQSHPHEWINVTITPETNSQGSITALQEQWEFDPLAAQVLLEPALRAPNNAAQQQAMQMIEMQVRQSLEQQHNYTYSQTPFAQAQQQTLSVENGILYYRFRLPLKTPQHSLEYRIYEPSYYIEMRYDEEKQQTRFASGCRLQITESSPSPAMAEAAYAIDKTGKGSPNLGRYFAQISRITCPAKTGASSANSR